MPLTAITSSLPFGPEPRAGRVQPWLLVAGDDREVLLWLVDGEGRLVAGRLSSPGMA